MPVEPPLQNDFDEELRELWQEQKLEGENMGIEEIHNRARRFERENRAQNLVEYLASVVVIANFALVFFNGPNHWVRAGAGLIVAATVFVVFVLYTRGSAQSLPESLGHAASLSFCRSSLERRRDLLLNVWKWYLFPFVPGFLLLIVGDAARDGVSPKFTGTGIEGWPVLKLLGICAVLAGLFWGVAALNKRNARKIQAQIDALEGTNE